MSAKETLGQKWIRQREERLKRRKNSPRARPKDQPKKESGKT